MSATVDSAGNFGPTLNFAPQKDFIPWQQLTRYSTAGGRGGGEHPFQVVDVSNGQYPRRIKIVAGVVNSTVPRIGGSDLDSLPVPTIDLPSGSTRQIYLKVTVSNGGDVTGVEVEALSSAPSDTLNLGYQAIASVTTNNSITAINQYVKNSLGHRRCRASDHVFWAL